MNNYVTPEYLITHGFVQYNSPEEGDIFKIPFYDEHAIHFREIDFHRQIFVVVLWPNDDDPSKYDHVIHVQEDAGCGFIEIPEIWAQLPVEYFESIYYGIRGEKPTKSV